MANAARWRWSVLLSALAATIAAIVYPVDPPSSLSAPTNTARPSHRTGLTRLPATIAATTRPAIDANNRAADNPFAVRDWQAPPPPPSTAPVVQPVAAVVAPPAPAAPPPLPFQFMGRLDDDGVDAIYLVYHDKMIVAREGATLDGTYKIAALTPQQIEFDYLPTGARQTLPLPAPDR